MIHIEAIKHYEAALKEAFPRAATGDVFEHWNKARIAIAEAEKQEPFGYFKYAMHFDAWVQNRDSNEGVAFYTHPQPKTEQEPDVIMHPHDGTWDIINSPPTGVDDVALYYAQPKREWVGLTDAEHYNLADKAGCMSADWVEFAKSIEQTLKEKNT